MVWNIDYKQQGFRVDTKPGLHIKYTTREPSKSRLYGPNSEDKQLCKQVRRSENINSLIVF